MLSLFLQLLPRPLREKGMRMHVKWGKCTRNFLVCSLFLYFLLFLIFSLPFALLLQIKLTSSQNVWYLRDLCLAVVNSEPITVNKTAFSSCASLHSAHGSMLIFTSNFNISPLSRDKPVIPRSWVSRLLPLINFDTILTTQLSRSFTSTHRHNTDPHELGWRPPFSE